MPHRPNLLKPLIPKGLWQRGRSDQTSVQSRGTSRAEEDVTPSWRATGCPTGETSPLPARSSASLDVPSRVSLERLKNASEPIGDGRESVRGMTSTFSGPRDARLDLHESEVGTRDARTPLLDLQSRHAALRNDANIHKTNRPLEGHGPIPDTEMDHFHVLKGKPGEKVAIGTRGISTCVALCGRGLTESEEPVLGLGHLSNLADPRYALKAMDDAMKAEGAVKIEFHLVGGMLMRDGNKNRLGYVEKLLDAAAELGIHITSAKLGTAESDPEEQDPGVPLLPSLGLPRKISAVVTPDEVVYSDESPTGSTILGAKRSLYAIDFETDEGIPLKVDHG